MPSGRRLLGALALGVVLAVALMHSGLGSAAACGGMAAGDSMSSMPGSQHASHSEMCLSTPGSVDAVVAPHALPATTPMTQAPRQDPHRHHPVPDTGGREPPDPVTELCVMRT